MDMASRQRNCTKCTKELVNPHGVHMGIPFGHWTYRYGTDAPTRIIVCNKCYDELTVDEHRTQRIGEQVI